MGPDPDDAAPPGGMRAREAVAAVHRGEISAGELLADARLRAGRWEPWLGAVVAHAGEAPGAGGSGPLAGVVAGVKDLLAVRGLPRWCGAPELADPAPQPADAVAVASLRQAGASIAATLQTHQFAYGIVTPQTRNPRALARMAGGSSGGPAAAVAAGMVHVALGTDTGGSVRIPASCCGVVGVKPTFGAIPVEGVQPLAPSLDTIGPLAGDVQDVALALSVLLGRPLPAAAPAALRVGLPAQTRDQDLDPEVATAWADIAAALRSGGAEVRDVSLPALAEASRANGIVLAVEASRVHAALLSARPEGFWPSVRERLERGRTLTPEDETWAAGVRDALRGQLAAAFEQVDVLLTPTLPCRVPAAGPPDDVDTVARRVTARVTALTNPWNLAGAPAGSVPVGRDADGGPVGMQVIGPWDAEALLLATMRVVEDAAGGPWSVAAPPAGTPG